MNKLAVALLAPILALASSLSPSIARAQDKEWALAPHEGFYLSVALGPTYVSSSMTTTATGLKDVTSGNTDASQSTTISSLALGGQVLVGGTIEPNLVLGGGSVGNVLFSPSRSWNGQSRSMHGYNLNLLGPFVDYTIEPSLALHLQVLVGAADATENPSGSATLVWGYGASVGVGIGNWVSRTLCIGLLLRGQLAHLSTSKDANVYSSSPGNTDLAGIGLSESQNVFSGGLLVDLTYH